MTHRYLALGDSYTIGESVRAAERWPVQLAAGLRERGLPFEAPDIVATTGWTGAELEAGIRRARPRGPYALVSLLIGVNNQYRGLDVKAYRRELDVLLGMASRFSEAGAGRVLVLSIPDWGVTPFAADRDRPRIAREIDAFNAVKRTRADEHGATFVDITDLTRDPDPRLVASDGLHPSAEAYRRWVERTLPVAHELLR